jgi:hypothetical protein
MSLSHGQSREADRGVNFPLALAVDRERSKLPVNLDRNDGHVFAFFRYSVVREIVVPRILRINWIRGTLSVQVFCLTAQAI